MQKQFRSVFDIIGPIMIGPSSSHTAGAARIGKMVRTIFGNQPKEVDIYLYESFAKTYRGHGTDIALIGGLLGMEPDNERLADSFQLAHESGMEVCFIPLKEKAEHPNQVKMVVSDEYHQLSITGISIGGGNIQISEVNGFRINLTLGTPTFLIIYQDIPGMVAKISQLLASQNINIGTMTVTRDAIGQNAIMLIEMDQPNVQQLTEQLKNVPTVKSVNFFQ